MTCDTCRENEAIVHLCATCNLRISDLIFEESFDKGLKIGRQESEEEAGILREEISKLKLLVE